MIRIIIAAVTLCALAFPAQARQLHHKTYAVDPGCNIIFPCQGVAASPRGERIVKSMGGFGAARPVYTPQSSTIVPHPAGCPARAFCGCGAAVRVFGAPVRALWLAAEWLRRFPRAQPAPGMVAARAHHVFVLEQHLSGDTWLAYDANSGGHATRIHARSISGYAIVNPHGSV